MTISNDEFNSDFTPQDTEPPTRTTEDKTWATIAHCIPIAAMWLSAGILGFIASIVVFLFGKDKNDFVRNYSAQALNIQLNAIIWFIVSWILVLVAVGLILIPIVAIWATILHVIALLKAHDGIIWKPPFNIQFIK